MARSKTIPEGTVAPAPSPEFSRPVAVAALGGRDEVRELLATPAECAALAPRLGVDRLDRLVARLTVGLRQAGRAVAVRGTVTAAVTRTCVVTLEPFDSEVEEAIETLFVAGLDDTAGVGEIEVDAVEAIDTEPLMGGRIDLGELVVQCLSLALDPHPRAPGAAVDPVWTADEAPEPEPEKRVLGDVARIRRGARR
ncbi:MAG: DUF177 domain-containing protein [Azospirillaceae bacterium]